MSWVKICDGAPEHPKWMELAEEPALWAACWGLWISCATYCARQLTDGRVPRAFVLRATPLPGKTATAAAEALVRVGLWTRDDAGYVFHDWLEHNPPAEKVRAKRAAAAERMSRGRKRSGDDGNDEDVRANFSRTESEQDAKFACEEPQPVRDAFATPVPVPLNNTHPAGARVRSGEAEHHSGSTGTGLYTRLYEYHRSVVSRYAPVGALRDLGPVAVLHTIRETLLSPLLRERTPEELERGLEMLGVQAKAKADAGEDDPWWPLRSAWSPRVLADALAMPDEQTAKTRAVKRLRGGPRGGGGPMPPPTSQPPNSHEYFAELARQQQAEKEAKSDPAT